MASHRSHLQLVHVATSGCGSEGCALGATVGGLCASCFSVYATAEVLYRRLVARDMARLERRTPGVGRAALAALHDRLAQLDPTIGDPQRSDGSALWAPEEWELDRLAGFLVELRGPGEGA